MDRTNANDKSEKRNNEFENERHNEMATRYMKALNKIDQGNKEGIATT